MIKRTVSLYKTSFTGLSAQTWLLAFIMLINRVGTMVLPFMTLYLTSKEMGMSLSDAGTVMGLFGLGVIVGAYFGGRLSDKIGFFKVQLIALIAGGFLFMVLGQLKSFPLICLFTFLLSLVNEAFRPANSAAVAFYSDAATRTRSYSLNRLAINLGWAAGASLGGLIAAYDYELLFWIDGFTNLLAAGLLYLFLRPERPAPGTQKPEDTVPAIQSAYRDVPYLWFIFLSILFSACFFQLFTTVPSYFRDHLQLNEFYIGLMMAVNGLIIVGFEMVLIYILEKKNKNRLMFYISLGTLICGLSFLSLLLPGQAKTLALLMILLISFGEIMSMPFMNTFWISRSGDKNRGQYAGLYTIAWGVGQSLGPFAGSHLAEAGGFPSLFLVLGGVLFLSAAGFWALRRHAQGI